MFFLSPVVFISPSHLVKFASFLIFSFVTPLLHLKQISSCLDEDDCGYKLTDVLHSCVTWTVSSRVCVATGAVSRALLVFL